MSPRAACRLAHAGFNSVFDFVGGKEMWRASGLPIEGTLAGIPTVGDAVERAVPTCRIDDSAAVAGRAMDDFHTDYCIVTSDGGVVLGRVRRSRLTEHDETGMAELMEPGPTTVRPHTSLTELDDRMHDRGTPHVIVTHASGTLVGVLQNPDLR